VITDEHKKHCKVIRDFLSEKMNVNKVDVVVEPLILSKQYTFKAIVNGKTMKVRIYPFKPANLKLHFALMDTDFKVPKILYWEENYSDINVFIKVVEWVEGVDIRERMDDHKEFLFMPKELMRSWGEYMGTLQNYKYDTMNISIHDMFWFNFIVTPENKVVCCDFSKLHCLHFPETDIFRWIVFNQTMPLDKKIAFIDGYLDKRDSDYKEQLKATEHFLNRIRHVEGLPDSEDQTQTKV